MDEVEAFMKKAKTKLKHSQALYDIGGYADSVTLSYYAMFLSAKALLIKKGVFPGKTHKGLIKKFNFDYVHNDNFEYAIYQYLANTQSLREEANYSAIDELMKT